MTRPVSHGLGADLIARLRAASRRTGASVVFPETADPRVLAAADRLARDAIVRPILIGRVSDVREAASCAGVHLHGDVELLDPTTIACHEELIDVVCLARSRHAVTRDEAAAQLSIPLTFAAALVRAGRAQACVAGAATSSAAVLQAALRVIGLRESATIVSGAFLIVLTDGRTLTFADCAVVPEPDARQLAEIAIASAATHEELTGEVPRVAMLSFSTKGSAEHQAVVKVREATDIVRTLQPGLCVDGELQFDAAAVASVGQCKAPGSPVAGCANVCVFPNLDAANIGYKIAERLAGGRAIGPLLQGLAHPMHDLSRGCSVEDIITVSAIAALQAGGLTASGIESTA